MCRSNPKHCENCTDPEPHDPPADRGMVEPRIILRGIVVLIVIGPLTAAAIDIQTALASTPTITPVVATVLALLIVFALLAAAVEGE